ncbi:MAG: site-2 protease family protein [Candidatus Micrarchaeota archaeon]
MDQREIIEIAGSWLVISVAFGWVMRNNFSELAFPNNFYLAFVVAAVAVGTGFILHELSHKYAAIHYGARAAFFAWPMGLVLALGLAFGLGFVFAAPGAVYIFKSNLTKRENGIISVAGPIVNIALGFLFLAGSVAFFSNPLISLIFSAASQINFFLALFNLIPLGPLDGKKVFDWNKPIWAILFLPLLVMFYFL